MSGREKETMYLGRDPIPLNLDMVGAEDSVVFDREGRRYVDFVMGWCVGNLGWSQPDIQAAIKQSRSPAYVHPSYLYEPWVELAESLAVIAPGKLKKSYRATGGTEAVEIAMQVAMTATKRHKFVSIEGSYHGNSIAAMSIGASEYRAQYEKLLPGCYKVKAPLDSRAVKQVERLLKREDIAAFIMEPVICNLDVTIPDPQFMTGVWHLCREHGTLLVMDEVATGFGRTGKLFGCEHFELEPDVMCLAKAITGGYAPMGATMVTDAVAQALGDRFSFYSTYGWHPLSVDAALANVRYFIKHKEDLLRHVIEVSAYFEARLSQMRFKFPTTIRMRGLAIGIEVDEPGYAAKIQDKALERGLLLSAENDVLKLFPALTVTQETAKEGLDILETCV
ncbi:MAG TPA: aspartate aminotransferase family protein [Nitrospira sp.]|nr:aspartate aminotransferase family protein [Nitrospira sp.]